MYLEINSWDHEYDDFEVDDGMSPLSIEYNTPLIHISYTPYNDYARCDAEIAKYPSIPEWFIDSLKEYLLDEICDITDMNEDISKIIIEYL